MTYRFFFLVLLCLALDVHAQTPPAVYVIFDASGSMWGQLPDKSHKVVVAKTVLQDFLAQDFGDTELAFRAYGHRRKGDCTDSELIAPFGPSAAVAAQVQGFMETLNPLGKTPIAYSLRQALTDFGDRNGEIILITDGIETCDDDPCALMREWQGKNVNVNVHVVGFGLEEQEKASLQCISEAAGTAYHDAASAMDLAAELTAIQEATVAAPAEEPSEEPHNQTVGFWLQGVTAEDEPIRVEGMLSQEGTDRFEVTSNRRNQVEAGTYDLLVGVLTVNGTLYQPVRQTVTTSDSEDTVVSVEVAEPPSVRARFVDVAQEDEDQRGAQITAYQNGAEVFRFRWMDEVYLDEGTYVFRARPNLDNELSVTETFAAGDHKEIVFEMVHTVHARFTMLAEGSGVKLRGNYELWQDGEKKYDVHTHNGADILPGTYDVYLVNEINPHIEPGVVVSTDDEQAIDITVPVGHITFIYQNADGSRDADKRVFLARDSGGRVRQSGEPHALIPGTYTVKGWRGTYDDIVFEVKAGEDKEIVLRNK